MRLILIAVIITLFMITPVMAQSIYYETIIQLEGEYKLTSITGGEIFKVEGVGKSYMERRYASVPDSVKVNWWNLF